MKREIDQVIAERVEAPELILAPERREDRRGVHGGGPELEPDVEQTRGALEMRVSGHVAVVVPDVAGVHARSVSGQGEGDEDERRQDGLAQPVAAGTSRGRGRTSFSHGRRCLRSGRSGCSAVRLLAHRRSGRSEILRGRARSLRGDSSAPRRSSQGRRRRTRPAHLLRSAVVHLTTKQAAILGNRMHTQEVPARAHLADPARPSHARQLAWPGGMPAESRAAEQAEKTTVVMTLNGLVRP